ncbi:MAG TPA: AarF/UbiB family protein [Mycobacteriales bacterium]|jgi:ubiquinone biosynthesis protein|nr:AarF/UbiB family protein [Mycobacteriales bacterium]
MSHPAPSDLHLGAFTANGPWLVQPEAMPWRAGLDARREATRQLVPQLVRHRLLPGWHACRVTAVLVRQVLPWWLLERRRGGDEATSLLAVRLRRAFERLGPTFIKLGQLVASGEGLLPAPLIAEFKKLQDRVAEMPLPAVLRVVEADLDGTVAELFESFDPTPIAAASIAQVHGATLPGGQEVVIKVQREDIATIVRKDLRVMMWLARLLVGRIKAAGLANPPAYVELFAETIVEELDFQLEAQNLLDIAEVLARTEQRQIVCPRPHPSLITRRVLVMERLYGYRIDDVDSINAAGIDTAREMLRGLLSSFFEGAIIFGVFHGDLHAGNTLVTADGRAALFDFGITGRFPEPKRLAVMQMMMASATQDYRAQLSALVDLGMFPAGTDVDAVLADLDLDTLTAAVTAGPDTAVMVDTMKLVFGKLLGHGAKIPKELMLLIKGVIYLDGAITSLAANLNIGEEVGHLFTYMLETHGDALAMALGFDVRLMNIDPKEMMAQMTAMSGLDTDGDVTFGEMRRLQAQQHAEIRELIQPRRRKKSI